VVGVLKGCNLVAVIETRQKLVEQARGYDNRSSVWDPDLHRAIEAWMEKFGLEWKADDEDDDEDDFPAPNMDGGDLPF
jgi:hypothetical protein